MNLQSVFEPAPLSAAVTRSAARDDIQGLRAVAVLGVLTFHFQSMWLPGGFLGVDVFFVISGYLISANIVRDLQLGSFSLREFYVRRFRRLFPASIATILVTAVASCMILPPDQLLNLGSSALSAVLFVANIESWMQTGYFDASAHTKPLLHFWSLAVEEQFYLVWPSLILFLVWIGRADWRKWLTPVFIAIGAVSLGATVAMLPRDPAATFYLSWFRAFEFCIGAALAGSQRMPSLPRSASTIVSVCGLLTIVASFVFLSAAAPMPGWLSLIPCLGAACIIVAGHGSQSVVLANRPMIFLGTISYSLYLVHWPIAIFVERYLPPGTAPYARVFGMFVLSVVIGYALFRWVEQPFRTKRTAEQPRASGVLISFAVALLATEAIAATIFGTSGLRFRLPPELRSIPSAVEMWKERDPTVRARTCFLLNEQPYSDFDPVLCLSLDPKKRNVLVIGDSVAADAYSYLSQAYPDVHFLQATSGSCHPTLIYDVGTTCGQILQHIFETFLPSQTALEGVVLSAAWGIGEAYLVKDTAQLLTARYQQEVFVIGPPTLFMENVPDMIAESGAQSIDEATQYARDHRFYQTDAISAEIDMVSGVDIDRIVDIRKALCDGCRIFTPEGMLIYLDFLHLTKSGATYAADKVRAHYPNLFSPRP